MGKRRHRRRHRSRNTIISAVSVALLGAVVLTLVAVAFWNRDRTPDPRVTDYVAKPMPTPTAPTFEQRVSVIGDSYTGGSKMGGGGKASWSRQFINDLDWPVSVHATGGGGFAQTSPDGRRFIDRVPEIAENQPSIVILAGGHNDRAQSREAIQAGVVEVIEAVEATAPDARIIVVGPIEQRDPGPQYLAVRDAIFDAASDAGVVDFIDPLEEGWFNGDLGVGGANSLIGSDGVHPTDAGHVLMAQKMRAHMDELGITTPR